MTNPFGSGTREWARRTQAKIAVNTDVLGHGELLVDEAGHVYAPDGVTLTKNLPKLINNTDLTTALANLPNGGTTEVGMDSDGVPYLLSAVSTISISAPAATSFPLGIAIPGGVQFVCTDSIAAPDEIIFIADVMPSGLTLNVDGSVTGIPDTAGTVVSNVEVYDSTGAYAVITVTWTIGAPSNTITVDFPGNRSKTIGLKASVQFTATDTLTPSTLTWSVSGQPPGLSINATTGLMSGTVGGSAAAYTVVATATDQLGVTGSTTFTFTTTAPTATVTMTNPGDQTGVVNQTITPLQIDAHTTSTAALSYAATGLPDGLTQNAVSGLISGKPTNAGTFAVTDVATDSSTSPVSTASVVFNWLISNPVQPGLILPPRGAGALGSVNYTIPTSNVIYLDPQNGVNTNNGLTTSAPVKTMAQAFTLLRTTGGTVVVGTAAGTTYTIHERADTTGSYADITVQNFPGAIVWWEGAARQTVWTKVGSAWVHTYAAGTQPQFARNGTNIGWRTVSGVNAQIGTDAYADLSDQVFLNGLPLQQVADNSANPGVGNFSVNYTAGTVTIGSDPTGNIVKVSDLIVATQLSSLVNFRGIGFRYFSSDYTGFMGGAIWFGGSKIGGYVENCWFQYMAIGAVNVATGTHNFSFRKNTVEHCGYTAIAGNGCDGFILQDNIIRDSNTGKFSPTPAMALGAVKMTRAIGLTYSNNEVDDCNGANGLWIDVTVVRFNIVHNYVHATNSSFSKGIHTEDSGGGNLADGQKYSYIAGNVVVGGRWGIQCFTTDHVKMFNNECRNNSTEYIDIAQDRVGNTANEYLTQAQCPWWTSDIFVSNNILGPGSPTVKARVSISNFTGDTRTADQMNVNFNNNNWVDATFQLQWGNGTNNGYTDYSSITTAQSAHSSNLSGNILGAMADSQALALTADQVTAIGGPASMIGSKRLGAWIGESVHS